MAVLPLTQQTRETSGRIETRKTQPIDGSVIADERGRAGVPYESVIFDAKRHEHFANAKFGPLWHHGCFISHRETQRRQRLTETHRSIQTSVDEPPDVFVYNFATEIDQQPERQPSQLQVS